MMKKVFISLALILSLFFTFPVESFALSGVNGGTAITDSFYILSDDVIIDYDDDQECSGANSILGNPDDPDSVAWLLQKILNYIKIIGPILIVVLSSVDFSKVIINGDEKAMNGALKNLGLRLIFAILLFFIPVIVNFILGIFGLTSDPTCGLQ
ncbi:MAG: hypothetical protein IJI22_04295 [Bacilli bacterium]|nr:hypothetical protein [Bacilli bacterium]